MPQPSRRQSIPPASVDRPMTEEGADLLARRAGYRLVGVLLEDGTEMPEHWLAAADGREVIIVEGAPWFALFAPQPDDGAKRLYIIGGRTKGNALRGGVALVQALSNRVHF